MTIPETVIRSETLKGKIASPTLVTKLARLLEISVTLNSTLEREPLLQYILDILTEVLECEASSIMLYDEKQGELLFVASTGSDQKKLEEIPVPLKGSIAGTIFVEKKPLLIHDVNRDPRHFTRPSEHVNFQPCSILGAPMKIRETTIGVIEALNKRNGNFTTTDLRILEIIASQAAVAIQNARLHAELQGAYEELSQVEKLKSDFIAIASHELRTPVGHILGYTSLLQDEVQGTTSDHTTHLMKSALRLRTLVEEMTNMNLLNLGDIDLDLQVASLQDVIREALVEINSADRFKGHHLETCLPKKPPLIQVDVEKIKQVFVNVINNAIRFTPKGGAISIGAEVKNGEVWVRIHDSGIGVPPDKLSSAFERFFQVDDPMTRRYGGLGLGLPIAKGLVELHKGRIWMESEGENMGTTVIIVLSRYQPD